MMLSSLRQHPVLAFHGILSIGLLLMIAGCGGSSGLEPASSEKSADGDGAQESQPSEFDPTSFKKSARFLAKSKPYLDFEAAGKAKNPVLLQKARDEFAASVAALKGQEVRWTVTVSKIEETGFGFNLSNQSHVFVVGRVPSKNTPDWKTTVAGLAVGQSVNITAKIKDIDPYASYQDMMETLAKDAGVAMNVTEVNEKIAKVFAKKWADIFAGITNMDEKRDAPFIVVAFPDAKID